MLWLKCQKQITGETAEVNKQFIAGCSGAGHAFSDEGMPFLFLEIQDGKHRSNDTV